MSTIDLGGGQTVKREHLPEHLRRALDQANSAVESAQANIRQWARPLTTLQAPEGWQSEGITCNIPQQSGITYKILSMRGIVDVDERDLTFFRKMLKFTDPSEGDSTGTTEERPDTITKELPVGWMHNDTQLNALVIWDGSFWRDTRTGLVV